MSFEVVCFDCDSTLSKIEGIDELAKQVGLGEAMARLTNLAMNGDVPLEAVYGQRLSLIRPDQASIAALAEQYIAAMVEGVKDVFDALLAQGKTVHIVSGGLRQAILPLAQVLGIPAGQVHAVDIFFNSDGSYSHFDSDSPLAQSGGKAIVASQLAEQGKLVMVGDGKTDMEAKQAGAFTIGFGGVVERPVVRELADVYVADASLLAVLRYI